MDQFLLINKKYWIVIETNIKQISDFVIFFTKIVKKKCKFTVPVILP